MEFLFTLKFLKVALTAIVIFVLLDLLWIGVVAAKMYSNQLGFLAELKDGKVVFKLPVGLLVQVILAFGLAVIICIGLQLDNRWVVSVLLGGFTGFVIYFTYDMTNYSFVKGWPLSVSIIDIGWGTLQGVLAGIYVRWLYNIL